jgi:hypothetical protein
MDPDAFISAAIDAGWHHLHCRPEDRSGVVAALDADQRLVWLISQAEIHCDTDGIDTFLDFYSPRWAQEAAAAFAEVGADEIAAALRAIAGGEQSDQVLDRANELITDRAGYDYESIRAAVARRLARRTP